MNQGSELIVPIFGFWSLLNPATSKALSNTMADTPKADISLSKKAFLILSFEENFPDHKHQPSSLVIILSSSNFLKSMLPF